MEDRALRAIFFSGPSEVTLADVPRLEPRSDEVVVTVKASALCAADLDPYHGKPHAGVGTKAQGPVIPGHEGCGIVKQIGGGVKSVKVGDRVATYCFSSCGGCKECLSGFRMLCRDARCLGFDVHGPDAEELLIPEVNCLRIPDWMSYEEGSLTTDLFGTTFTAARRIGVDARDSVAIFGLGPIGACEAIICKALGAEVIGIDIIESRLAMAKRLGCDRVINASEEDPVETIRTMTDGGTSTSIDCSGNARAERTALDCVTNHGRVAFVGWGLKAEIEPAQQIITKDLTIRGSWYFNVSDYQQMIDFIGRKRIPLKELISHTFNLERAAEAFSLFDAKQTLKPILIPG